MSRLIALVGYGRSGKDVLGEAFVEQGFVRHAFGDIIKGIFDIQCQKYLGYSAFTEDAEQKERIRPLLVHGGQTFYQHVSKTYFGVLDRVYIAAGLDVINTRLFRIEEAREWVARGGEIWVVMRKDNGPKEPEEARSLQEIEQFGIHKYVYNDGNLEQWQSQSRALALEVTQEIAKEKQ